MTPNGLNLQISDFGNNVVGSCSENSSGPDTGPWGEHPIASAGAGRTVTTHHLQSHAEAAESIRWVEMPPLLARIEDREWRNIRLNTPGARTGRKVRAGGSGRTSAWQADNHVLPGRDENPKGKFSDERPCPGRVIIRRHECRALLHATGGLSAPRDAPAGNAPD